MQSVSLSVSDVDDGCLGHVVEHGATVCCPRMNADWIPGDAWGIGAELRTRVVDQQSRGRTGVIRISTQRGCVCVPASLLLFDEACGMQYDVGLVGSQVAWSFSRGAACALDPDDHLFDPRRRARPTRFSGGRHWQQWVITGESSTAGARTKPPSHHSHGATCTPHAPSSPRPPPPAPVTQSQSER